MEEDSPTWQRLIGQIRWYDQAARKAQRRYRLLKVAEIVVAAAIPATAAVGGSVGLAGVLGAIVVVLAGLQSLFGFQTNWTTYRATCEALRREKHLFQVGAGQYGGDDREKRFALTIEGLMSEETTQWAAAQQELAQQGRV